jgi:hypothetical protein
MCTGRDRTARWPLRLIVYIQCHCRKTLETVSQADHLATLRKSCRSRNTSFRLILGGSTCNRSLTCLPPSTTHGQILPYLNDRVPLQGPRGTSASIRTPESSLCISVMPEHLTPAARMTGNQIQTSASKKCLQTTQTSRKRGESSPRPSHNTPATSAPLPTSPPP